MAFKDVLKEEFIGETMEVVEADNETLVGLQGEIVDETKNTFKIQTKDGLKNVLKDQIKFTITKNNKKIKIDGKKIHFRSEERIKKIR